MSSQGFHRLSIALVLAGLLLSTSAGNVSASFMRTDVPTLSGFTMLSNDDEPDDSGGGWLDTIVETGGDIVGGTKDIVVDVAGGVWDVAQQAPGAVWDFIVGIPGAVGGLFLSAWGWLINGSIDLSGWPAFLERFPILGAILGPIVQILLGLSPDGTISYLEIGLGLIAFAVPVVKGAQVFGRGVTKTLPWVDDAGDVVGAVRRNPGGLIDGISTTYRFARAKSIAPTADDFATLPGTSGVYVAVDATGQPLYVGMSSALSRRVPQHFSSSPSRFADSTARIKIIPTKSVTEALALECTLIKSVKPKFNVIHNNANACPAFLGVLPARVP